MKVAAASIAQLQTVTERRTHRFAAEKALHKPYYKVVPNWPGQKRQLFLEPSAKKVIEHP